MLNPKFVISRQLIVWTYPEAWLEKAREKVEEEAGSEEEDFDWRKRIRSIEGWHLVGHKFAAEWAMVWQEIAIGFTVAGFVAVLVPDAFWKAIFLVEKAAESPLYFPVVLENTLLAPFVAAATFIGSMGNIPLATVLNSSGVLFAGIMGFIYSDLMVPPLVEINARYYGWRVALYIAAVMYVSIVCTALTFALFFCSFGGDPGKCARREGRRSVQAGLYFLDEFGRPMSGGLADVAEPFLAPSQQRRGNADGRRRK